MLILLWGLPGESPLAAVYEELVRLGIPTVLLDQRDVLDTEIELSVGSHIQGFIRTPYQNIDLGAVTAVYLRPYDSRRLPEIAKAGATSSAWQHAIARLLAAGSCDRTSGGSDFLKTYAQGIANIVG